MKRMGMLREHLVMENDAAMSVFFWFPIALTFDCFAASVLSQHRDKDWINGPWLLFTALAITGSLYFLWSAYSLTRSPEQAGGEFAFFKPLAGAINSSPFLLLLLICWKLRPQKEG